MFGGDVDTTSRFSLMLMVSFLKFPDLTIIIYIKFCILISDAVLSYKFSASVNMGNCGSYNVILTFIIGKGS